MRGILPIALLSLLAHPALAADAAPYRILKTVTVGGPGGFDYVRADSDGRRLYIARSGKVEPRVMVFDLDTLAPAGTIAGFSAHGVAVDTATLHGFASSKPVTMFDTRTQQVLKTLPITAESDGILADGGRIYVFGDGPPNVSIYNAADGSVAGTIDLQASPEEAVADGKGHLYIDLNDKNQIGVVDTKSLAVTARYDLGSACGLPTGLALDGKNHILFASCRNPQAMVAMNALTGAVLASIPIGLQTDGAAFNPNTNEAFAPTGDGHLTIVKESSPTSFAVEQVLDTAPGARTIALDKTTGHIFLITADYAPPPPGMTVKPGRIARGPALPDTFKILEIGR
jgi:DNA-binding beta-propeller fold protein YncE